MSGQVRGRAGGGVAFNRCTVTEYGQAEEIQGKRIVRIKLRPVQRVLSGSSSFLLLFAAVSTRKRE